MDMDERKKSDTSWPQTAHQLQVCNSYGNLIKSQSEAALDIRLCGPAPSIFSPLGPPARNLASSPSATERVYRWSGREAGTRLPFLSSVTQATQRPAGRLKATGRVICRGASCTGLPRLE